MTQELGSVNLELGCVELSSSNPCDQNWRWGYANSWHKFVCYSFAFRLEVVVMFDVNNSG